MADVLTTAKAWDVLQSVSMVYGVAIDLLDSWSSLSSKSGELPRGHGLQQVAAGGLL
jgi:hypothetical protein